MTLWILALPLAALCARPCAGHRQLFSYLGTDFRDLGMQGSFVNSSEAGDPEHEISKIGLTPWAPFLSDGKFMGEGAFGAAFLYKLKAPCEGKVVVKQIKQRERHHKQFLRDEIATLKDLRGHPNVLQLYDYYPRRWENWFRPVNLQLMSEVAYGGELDSAFFEETGGWFGVNGRIHGYLSASAKEKRREIKKKIILMMMRDMLAGLEFIHSKGYIHRDIKPPNLWSANEDDSCVDAMTCRYILGDLGLAKKCNGSTTGFSGTPIYMPPEMRGKQIVVFRSDIYSLAFSIAILMAFPMQFPKTGAREILETATSKQYYPEGLRQLISEMTLRDYHGRPTASDALLRVKAIIKADFPDAPTEHQNSQEPPCVAACRGALDEQRTCEPGALAKL